MNKFRSSRAISDLLATSEVEQNVAIPVSTTSLSLHFPITIGLTIPLAQLHRQLDVSASAEMCMSVLWVVQRYGAVGGIVQSLRCETTGASTIRSPAVPVSSRGASPIERTGLRRYSVLLHPLHTHTLSVCLLACVLVCMCVCVRV